MKLVLNLFLNSAINLSIRFIVNIKYHTQEFDSLRLDRKCGQLSSKTFSTHRSLFHFMRRQTLPIPSLCIDFFFLINDSKIANFIFAAIGRRMILCKYANTPSLFQYAQKFPSTEIGFSCKGQGQYEEKIREEKH